MQYKRVVFKNGLRLITVPMRDNQTVTVLVLVEAGSKYETKRESGLSHFLEHMCFKGTEKRPSTYAISHELDAIGSQYNAFTSYEYTGYYAKADMKHFGKIFDVVSDIYLHPTFPKPEIEKEKGVIVEEINMYEDTPQRHVQDLFMSLLYGDTPAGRNIAGTRDSVRSMKQADFVKYHRAHYVPKATTIIVSGNIREKEVVREVTKQFGSLPNKKKSPKVKVTERQTKPALTISYKATDQSHLVVGFRAFDTYDKRNYALDVLSQVFSGGFSSRLFMKLREELGIAYYVRAGTDTFTDHGFFEIKAGVSNGRVEEALKVILAECTKLSTELITDGELEKTKEYMIGNMKLELESSDAWAMYFGGQEVMRKHIETPDTIEQKIRKVNARDVKKVASHIFKNETLNVALIGPHKDTKTLKRVLKI